MFPPKPPESNWFVVVFVCSAHVSGAECRAQVKENVAVPVIWNGDIFSDADAVAAHQTTGVDGTSSPESSQQTPC
jgi:hypothetical protein